MAIVGLDIGSDTIKVVEMAKGRGGYHLLNYGIAPTPPDAVANGDIQDPEMLGEAIRQLLSSRKIKTNTTVSSVQGKQSLVVRIIDLPRCEPKELAETMKFEVERHIPFPASQIIMDYTVLERPGESKDSPNMEVLFAAVQEEVINIHVDCLRQAKLKPRAIDVQPLALSRAVVEAPDDAGGVGETVAIVNIGASCTELCIVRDGVLHFPRTIPIGGRNITQRLSEGLGISEQQADRQKRQFATMRSLTGATAAAAPVEAAESEAEEEATGDEFGFGEALFGYEGDDDSDVGFGGTGSGHGAGDQALSFDEDTGGAEVHVEDDDEGEGEARSPFELPDEPSGGGPLFDFGTDSDDDNTSFSLTAADDGDEGPVEEEDTGGFSFSFGDDDDAAEPAADEPVAFSFDADAAEPDEETDGADGGGEAVSFDFGMGSGDEDSGDAAAAPAGGAAGDEPTFDFALGGESDESSLTESSLTDTGGATDVGSSFDLGDLATDDGLAFEFGDEPEATAEVPPPTAAAEDSGEPTFDTAEDLDDGGGLAFAPTPEDAERAQVHDVIEPVVREIAGELGRSLEYYRSRYEGAVINRMVLVGGTALIDGLAEFFQAELGLDVEIGDPVGSLVINNPKLSDDDLKRHSPLLAVAVGLALRELG